MDKNKAPKRRRSNCLAGSGLGTRRRAGLQSLCRPSSRGRKCIASHPLAGRGSCRRLLVNASTRRYVAESRSAARCATATSPTCLASSVQAAAARCPVPACGLRGRARRVVLVLGGAVFLVSRWGSSWPRRTPSSSPATIAGIAHHPLPSLPRQATGRHMSKVMVWLTRRNKPRPEPHRRRADLMLIRAH